MAKICISHNNVVTHRGNWEQGDFIAKEKSSTRNQNDQMTSFEAYLKGEKKSQINSFFYILVMLYQQNETRKTEFTNYYYFLFMPCSSCFSLK